MTDLASMMSENLDMDTPPPQFFKWNNLKLSTHGSSCNLGTIMHALVIVNHKYNFSWVIRFTWSW